MEIQKIKYNNNTTIAATQALVAKQFTMFRQMNIENDPLWYYRITYINDTEATFDVYCWSDETQGLIHVQTVNSASIPLPKISAVVMKSHPTDN